LNSGGCEFVREISKAAESQDKYIVRQLTTNRRLAAN